MRLPALLLSIWLAPSPVQAQGRNSVSPEYSPAQVLNALRLLREQRGDPNPPKLSVCLKNSSDGRWSDLQAHFYCWLKPDQRACFTGAVDGEFKDHPGLKGNYDMAFSHCQEAKGRAYGINFDRPMARFTLEQGEVFKNLLYRQPVFSQDDQRKILEAFYSGQVPERKYFPAQLPPAPIKTAPVAAAPAKTAPAPVAASSAKTAAPVAASSVKTAAPVAASSAKTAAPVAASSVKTAAPVAAAPVKTAPALMAAAPTMVNPDMAEMENAVPTEGYPQSCQVKINHARTRQQPDSNSPIVAILDPTPIKVTGPAQASSGSDTKQWYPVEFHQRGKIVNAWLSVSLVDCPK